MNSSTVTALIVLQSVGLVVSLGVLGAAIFVAVKAKREVKAMTNKYRAAKEEFRVFASRIQNIL